jgi:hypothetical protein
MTPSQRRTREAEFLTSGGLTQSFSHELLASACALLDLSLDERRDLVWREIANHATRHAPGIVILATTALDTWLTEHELTQQVLPGGAALATPAPLRDRLAKMFLETGKAIDPALNSEFQLLVDLRDELVHFLPRFKNTRTVPPLFALLDQRGLFIHIDGIADFSFYQKLGSYALGWWALDTVASCIVALLAQTPHDKLLGQDATGRNFLRHRRLTSPSALAAFDAKHGLLTTAAERAANDT